MGKVLVSAEVGRMVKRLYKVTRLRLFVQMWVRLRDCMLTKDCMTKI